MLKLLTKEINKFAFNPNTVHIKKYKNDLIFPGFPDFFVFFSQAQFYLKKKHCQFCILFLTADKFKLILLYAVRSNHIFSSTNLNNIIRLLHNCLLSAGVAHSIGICHISSFPFSVQRINTFTLNLIAHERFYIPQRLLSFNNIKEAEQRLTFMLFYKQDKKQIDKINFYNIIPFICINRSSKASALYVINKVLLDIFY